MKSKKVRGLIRWGDAVGLLIHAGAILLALHYEILPHILDISETLAGVLWVLWLTFVWTVYIFLRFYLQKVDFQETNAKLREQVSMLSRNSRYASAIEKINFGFTTIHGLLRDEEIINILKLDEKNADQETLKNQLELATHKLTEIDLKLRNFCDKISDVFNHITGVSDCAVCIKIFRGEDPNEKAGCSVYTLIRDDTSDKKRGHEKEKQVTHWVSSNTAYLEIYNRLDKMTDRCFFCNDLPLLPNYNNTSFQIYGHPSKRPGSVGVTKKELIEAWTLPYLSTIVAPLCPIDSKKSSKDEIIGYLCIDSGKNNVFDKTLDQNLMVGIADGIYNSVKQCISLQKKGRKIETRIEGIK